MAPLLAHLHESGQALTNDISCIEQKSNTEIKTALDFILKFWIHFVTTDFTWLKLLFFSSKHHCTCFGFTVHSLTEMIKLRRRCARQPPPSILLSSPSKAPHSNSFRDRNAFLWRKKNRGTSFSKPFYEPLKTHFVCGYIWGLSIHKVVYD